MDNLSREIAGTPIPILLPYHSHNNPLKYGNGMGSLSEPYGKGVPLLGVPGGSPTVSEYSCKVVCPNSFPFLFLWMIF